MFASRVGVKVFEEQLQSTFKPSWVSYTVNSLWTCLSLHFNSSTACVVLQAVVAEEEMSHSKRKVGVNILVVFILQPLKSAFTSRVEATIECCYVSSCFTLVSEDYEVQ